MSLLAELEAAEVLPATMFAVVKGKESKDDSWKETASLISFSSTGAGFYVNRECHVGRLISIMLPLEPHLRCYDHGKELYRIWGLVQHCHPRPAEEEGGYHVGVAFIGRHTPDSYREDPTQNYRICGMNEDGLWKVDEAAKAFKPRKYPRFYQMVNHYLAVVDAQNTAMKGERATTENISRSGAAVLSSMDLHVGDRVKFISEQFDFSGIAVVCNRQDAPDGKARLNLQFVENTFPVERIAMSAAAAGTEPAS